MKREKLIHKLVITAEAVFDYEEDMKLGKIPRTDIKNLIEDYLAIVDEERSLECVNYLSVKYLSDGVAESLKLFLYKGRRFGKMQIWELRGICEGKDWDKDLESTGVVKNWLGQKVENLARTSDWVEEMHLMEEIERKEWLLQEEEWEVRYGECSQNFKRI